MIQYKKIDDSKDIDTFKSKKYEICHYKYFNNGFKSDSKVCSSCKWGIKSFGNFAIITVNDVDYRVFVLDMTEDEAMVILKNFEPNES